MELYYCGYCNQMTNHQVFKNGQIQCLKCGKGDRKLPPSQAKEKAE